MTKSNQPVTVLFSRVAKVGKEQEYEAWNRQLIRLSEQQPGHIMTSVVSEADRRYITLQRFASHERLQAWLQSPLRLDRLDKLDALTEDAPEPAELTGMEPWFKLPGQGGKGHVPRWKMAIVTFCVIYFFVLLMNIFLAPKIGSLPILIRTALFPMVMVPLMTYLVMPKVTKLLQGWLYR